MKRSVVWISGLGIILIPLAFAARFYLHSKPLVITNAGVDDACGTYSSVQGQDVKLHIRPHWFSRTKTHIVADQLVNVCETIGEWSAVVLAGKSGICIPQSEISYATMEYAGPCEYGWVESRFLQMLAG